MSGGWLHPAPADWMHVVSRALAEDIGPGDLSSGALEPEREVDWKIEAQASGVLCGVGLAEQIFPDSSLDIFHVDSDSIEPGTLVMRGNGTVDQILRGERVLLNFLMRLSGVASLTAAYVKAVQGLHVKIVDTRKTTPGLRSLEKYAVRCGGGFNHRMGLYDGVMIKDNHIAACGGIEAAIQRVRNSVPHTIKIEVECENTLQVEEAVANGAEIVLLDNMALDEMRKVAERFGDRCILEASGGVTLDTVRSIAETGVHLISVGALTHSAPAIPLHLEIE